MSEQTILQNEYERLDDLQYKGLRLIQDTRAFCFGLDAVLLANFAKVPKGAFVMDFCSGNGIIPVLLSGKTKAEKIVGVEFQEGAAALAERNILLNHLSERVSIMHADVKNLGEKVEKESVDVITCNPPYLAKGSGLISPSVEKALARQESSCTLADFIQTAALLLKQHGRFYMIHRPERMGEIIIEANACGLKVKRLGMVHPSPEKTANLVLIEAVKGVRDGLKLEPPLYVYNSDGEYTAQIFRIYHE